LLPHRPHKTYSIRNMYRLHSAAHCNTLQHTAAHCSTLQHSAAHCLFNSQFGSSALGNTLQHTTAHCNTLQHTAIHCNTLQCNRPHKTCNLYRLHTATHCNTLQHTATHCNTLQHTATHCNTLQHTATHCNAIDHTKRIQLAIYIICTPQHTATHCSTVQHTATHHKKTTQPTMYPTKNRSLLQNTVCFTWLFCKRGLWPQCILPTQPATCFVCAQQATATHCTTLQHTATNHNTLT